MDIKFYLKEKKGLVDAFLAAYFDGTILPAALNESMKYSLLAGGKRIRPVLCLAAYEACGRDGAEILPQACAIEFIHTYSLIHDDLPAMDDDDLRRGKPTNHVVFGEAMAILAGDALLTDAFRLFAGSRTVPADRLLAALDELAAAAGIRGMVAGQAQDIIAENTEPDRATVEFIHLHKTAALIRSSVVVGALLGGADRQTQEALTEYGRNIGLAFQVVDDILDITGSTEELGKPQGSDLEKKKMTYPAVYGLERSREIARELIDAGLAAVRRIKGDSEPLAGIAAYLLGRTN